MTRELLDKLWNQALHESLQAGEMFTRYRFAKLVADHERNECAKVCDAMSIWNGERCAIAIRKRGEQ